jgi:hypothetical protein
MDCSLWVAEDNKTHLIDDHYRANRPSPRIYIYDLPPEYNAWFDVRKLDRPVEVFFLERLMTSHHRVADPEEVRASSHGSSHPVDRALSHAVTVPSSMLSVWFTLSAPADVDAG